MPTPMSAYVEAARKFGNVDPSDDEAIDRFFVETFPSLSSKKKKQVNAFLLAHEGPGVQEADDPRVVTIMPRTTTAKEAIAAFTAAHAAIVQRYAGKFYSTRLPRSYKPVAPVPSRAPAKAVVPVPAKRKEHEWQE